MNARYAAILLLGVFGAGRIHAEEKIPIHVYIQTGNWSRQLGLTERITAGLFAEVGIKLIWHAGNLPETPRADAKSIGIRMAEHAPAAVTSLALAGSHPYASSGTLISIYKDRVEQLLASLPGVADVLLAYVFAHELAHVLVGDDHHSASGIMKPQWSPEDYAAMRARRLRFADSDTSRIRDAIAEIQALR